MMYLNILLEMTYLKSPTLDACNNIDSVLSSIEDIRTANATLRSWGGELEEEVIELLYENEELELKIEELKEELKNAYNERSLIKE